MEIIDQFIKLAANNEVNQLKKLIECGINVNGFDSKGRTALMAATFFNHIEVVTLLISADESITEIIEPLIDELIFPSPLRLEIKGV